MRRLRKIEYSKNTSELIGLTKVRGKFYLHVTGDMRIRTLVRNAPLLRRSGLIKQILNI